MKIKSSLIRSVGFNKEKTEMMGREKEKEVKEQKREKKRKIR